MKQPKEFTGYILLKCPTCKNIMRIYVGINALKGFKDDGISPFNYRIEKVDCGCGKTLFAGWGKPIYGRLTEGRSCNEKCRNSQSPLCSCSCKGAMHGKNWSIK